MFKKLSVLLVSTIFFVNGYADYDDKVMGELSKPNEFYIVTAHIDGNTSTRGDKDHPPEAMPSMKLPTGGGISIKEGDQGKWRMRVFKFIPSQIVTLVNQDLILHFVGAQGPSHQIKIDGVDEEVSLKRGEIKRITLRPKKTGVINFRSLGRQPSMSGQVIVIAK